MLNIIKKSLVVVSLALIAKSCISYDNNASGLRYQFDNILDISYTPNSETKCIGWFTDAGSWIGFTPAVKDNWVNGFCGPFSLDMNRREWLAKSAVVVGLQEDAQAIFVPDSVNYLPGELYISATSPHGQVVQQLNFIDATTALLCVQSDRSQLFTFTGDGWSKDMKVYADQNVVVARHPSGETVMITFDPEVVISVDTGNYLARSESTGKRRYVAISFLTSPDEINVVREKSISLLANPTEALRENNSRWNEYLESVLRTDMKPEYDRIAVKAVVTLMSNWRSHRAGLLHEGVVPSHGAFYFVGFWAWDTWRFSAAMAKFAPKLAKNNIRAMFDYQQPDGMIIDCIYTEPVENNSRNSKPPLVSWAVDEIFTHTADTAFVSEMYPQLLKYYNWWYEKRDHDHNGICEFGSTDGTLEAAAWESGMDNAIRFDNSKMLRNEGYSDAWSINQESIDLNAYLAKEYALLKKFAGLLGLGFDLPDHSSRVADYFFDTKTNFFYDRALGGGDFISEAGCEAYIPLWTGIATQQQVDAMMPMLTDTTKFSTYIPFPTVSADNPKYDPRGYWRGPIWLDQTYFAIKGLRNYGYKELADKYTLQVFDRLKGIKEGAPIHENYGTHTGELLKAPHFSWSSSHLLMLYDDYGR